MKQRKRISLDWLDRGRTALEPLLALAYPRHCPLCGTVLEQSAWKAAVCRSCIPEAERLRHLPPRLPVTEHAFYAVNTCAAAFLLCRQCAPCYPALQGERQPLVCARTGGFDGCADFWRTARPCPRVPPGIRESIRHFAVQRHCSGAAARKEEPRGKYAPLLAQRLGRILHIPVIQPLCLTRQVLPQKSLDQQKRFANVKDAYACRTGVDLSGMRLLLLDDVITTGATISACAKALLEGGAVSVDGVCVAATELMPKSHGAAGTPKESK